MIPKILKPFRSAIIGASLTLGLCAQVHATEARFSGFILDTREWLETKNPNHPAGPASGLQVSGWSLFGSGFPSTNFIGLEAQVERLPRFVSSVRPRAGAQVAQLPAYAPIQAPGSASENWVSGTVTFSAQDMVDLVRVRLGDSVPSNWRLGILIDNLDSPAYVSKEIRISIGDAVSPPVLTTGGAGIANGKPDWYFWDIIDAKPGAELIIRASPNSGVATLGGVIFMSQENAPAPRHVGEFSRPGEYMKDYYVFKEGDTFHLFYNVGDAGSTQDWQEPNNEKAFGHATSKDLRNWTHHPRILHVIPGTWEGQVVSAPSIIKHEGTYYMFYTGFDDRVVGKQSIGLATSPDLFNWTRHPGNPLYEAPAWTMRPPSGWIDCRDAHVIKHKDEFLLFTMVTTAEGRGAISLATSRDLKKWTDRGPAFITFEAPESPRVFEHKGIYYMFATSGHGKILVKTTDPKSGNWEKVPFRWPAPGFWSGWEVVQDGDRTIFSAFEWKFYGNHIRFWEVDWDGEVPLVRY